MNELRPLWNGIQGRIEYPRLTAQFPLDVQFPLNLSFRWMCSSR